MVLSYLSYLVLLHRPRSANGNPPQMSSYLAYLSAITSRDSQQILAVIDQYPGDTHSELQRLLIIYFEPSWIDWVDVYNAVTARIQRHVDAPLFDISYIYIRECLPLMVGLCNADMYEKRNGVDLMTFYIRGASFGVPILLSLGYDVRDESKYLNMVLQFTKSYWLAHCMIASGSRPDRRSVRFIYSGRIWGDEGFVPDYPDLVELLMACSDKPTLKGVICVSTLHDCPDHLRQPIVAWQLGTSPTQVWRRHVSDMLSAVMPFYCAVETSEYVYHLTTCSPGVETPE